MQRALCGQENTLALGGCDGFLVGNGAVLVHHAAVVGANRFGLQRKEHRVVMSHHLRCRLGNGAFDRAIDEHIATLAILGENGIGRVVGDRGQQLQGARRFRQSGKFLASPGQHLVTQATYQDIEQQGGDDDEQPAL